eukprot:13271985-Heterocapsa_arctica.AAC.1
MSGEPSLANYFLLFIGFSRGLEEPPAVSTSPMICSPPLPLADRGLRPPQSSLPRVGWVGPR